MTLIVCLDIRNGLRFNDRRQSSDRCVTERVIRMSEGRRLYILPESASLFSGMDCVVSEEISQLADGDDICFVETGDFSTYLDKTKTMVVYRWDKVYPADTKFPMDAFLERLSLRSTETFSGYSHDWITQEVYTR